MSCLKTDMNGWELCVGDDFGERAMGLVRLLQSRETLSGSLRPDSSAA
jgi:hypothetical protein